MNALELAAALLESGRAKLVLLVAAEHNSAYARDDDDQSGHLWGDGAAAMLLAPTAAMVRLPVQRGRRPHRGARSFG